MNYFQKHFSASLIALFSSDTAALMGAWVATVLSWERHLVLPHFQMRGLTCTGYALNGDVDSVLSVIGFPGYPAVLCTTTGMYMQLTPSARAVNSHHRYVTTL